MSNSIRISGLRNTARLAVLGGVLAVAGCAEPGPAFDTVRLSCADDGVVGAVPSDAIRVDCDRRSTLTGVAEASDTLAGFEPAAGPPVSDIDWEQAKPLALTVGDWGFAAIETDLAAFAPARLVIANVSDETQRISAEALLGTAVCSTLRIRPATLTVPGTVDMPPRQVRPAGHELDLSEVPCPVAISVRPGALAELSFVPTAPGLHQVRCEPCGAATFADSARLRVVR